VAILLQFIGALVITWLISRVLHRGLRRWVGYNINAALLANGVTLVLAVFGAAFGLANGVPPKFGLAFATYAPAVAAWLAFDILKIRKLTVS
jgi:hypothetical protein